MILLGRKCFEILQTILVVKELRCLTLAASEKTPVWHIHTMCSENSKILGGTRISCMHYKFYIFNLNPVLCFKMNGYTIMVLPPYFLQREHPRIVLFAALCNKTFPKFCLDLKEIICSYTRKSFPPSVDPY